MKIRIDRCYDSHVHLMATGQMSSMLQLDQVRSVSELEPLQIKDNFRRGRWIVGFGWDQHRFPNQKFPTRFDLDLYFPDQPVAFSRVDGHALWVNTQALRECGLLKPVRDWNLPSGAVAGADSDGFSDGILIDRAMELVFAHIPKDDLNQKKKFLKAGIHEFNRNGFTHLRDMSGDHEQWDLLCELERKKELTLYIDQNFSFDRAEDFEAALDLSCRAKEEKLRYLNPRGIKFYLDGALGSEGAAISRPYGGVRGKGFFLWSPSQIEEWMRRAWEQKVEVSVHTLGDEASHQVVLIANQVWDSGLQGFLNLEHVEILRHETLDLLRGRPVRLHFQPSHWLSDHPWLDEKIGPLKSSAFQWKAAFDRKIPMSWGSDAPIEPVSLFRTERALQESRKEVPMYPGSWWKPHEHPNPDWGNGCSTEIENGNLKQVIFDGERLI